MLTQPTLTEKIIRKLSSIEDILPHPWSWSRSPLNSYYGNKKREKEQKLRIENRVFRALKRLEKAEILSYSQTTQSYHLTPKGWLKYLYYYSRHQPQVKQTTQHHPNQFLITFDIPEKHRRFRDLLRQSLKNQGCHMIQKSLFSCPTEATFIWAQKIVSNCELDNHVLFIQANKIL